jgi:hypothetical protein
MVIFTDLGQGMFNESVSSPVPALVLVNKNPEDILGLHIHHTIDILLQL